MIGTTKTKGLDTMDKSKIYTAEIAAKAMADQILRGNRYAERFHISEENREEYLSEGDD